MSTLRRSVPRALFAGARRVLAVLAIAAVGAVAVPHAQASRLVVSSANSNSGLRFDAQTGAFLNTMVPGGSGGLTFPEGMAIGPDGNLYIRSAGNVLRYNGVTGDFLGLFASAGGSDPNAAAFQVRLDGGNTGNFVFTPATGGLDGPTGLAFGPDGNICVSSYGVVLKYSGLNGTPLGTFAVGGGLNNAKGLAFGPDGNLYVASYPGNTVLRYNGITGTFIDVFVTTGAGGLDKPMGLAFGPDNNLYVCSYNTDRVLKYSGSTGAFTGAAAVGSGLKGPTGVAFGPDGNLYVAGFVNDAVMRFDTTGTFIDFFVAPGTNGLDGPFCPVFYLQPPTALATTVNSTTQVTLAWVDNSEDETGFEIERKTGAGTYTTIAVVGPHTTGYVNSGLSANKTYTYRVHGVYGAGDSPNSNESVATTPVDPPAAPITLTVNVGLPGDLNLSWQDMSNNESGFEIWQKFTAGANVGSYQMIATAPANATSFAVHGLSVDAVWTYKVRAVSDSGASAYTNEASGTPLPPPPSAPTGLTATAISSTQINLAWTDTSTNETGFAVWRKSGADSFAKVADLPAGAKTFSDTALTPGVTYTYHVRAVNQGGASAWTADVSATTPDVIPAAPTVLAATASSPTQIDLTWQDNSPNETAFALWRKVGAGVYEKIADLAPKAQSYSDTGLTVLTTYTYKVRAVGTAGASDWSNEAGDTTPDVIPAAPTTLTATASSPTQIDLTWTDTSTNETGFALWRKVGAGAYEKIADLAPKAQSYADTGLTVLTTYTYKVRAIGVSGASDWSNEAGDTTPDVIPSAPTGLTAAASSPTQIDLTWTDTSTNETGFALWRKVGAGVYEKIADLAPKAQSYADTGLTVLTTYTYKVRAIGVSGASDWSNEAGDTTPDFIPAAPSTLTATASSPTQIDLAWTDASSNESAFALWRKVGAGAYEKIATLAPNTTTYSNTGLSPVTTYTYKVRAVGVSGASDWSNEAGDTTPDLIPSAPGGLAAHASSPTQIDLTWTDTSTNETGFALWRKVGAGAYEKIADLAPKAQSYADTGLTVLTTYTYKVRAIGVSGASDWSNEAGDTTPGIVPAAPSGLTATVISSTQINLAWKDNSNNETAFSLWRKVGTGPYLKIADIAPNFTKFPHSGLPPGTTITYRVRALGLAGDSDWSNETSATTPILTLPAAPTLLAASPLSSTQIKLTWADNSNNETAFAIFRKTGALAYAQIAVTALNVTTFTDPNLTPNTTYTYEVRATNNLGASAWTNEASAKTPDVPPAAPIGLIASPFSGTQINLTWQDKSNNETAFAIFRKTGALAYARIAVTAPNVTTFADPSLTPNTTYTYEVRATNNVGASAWTNEASATTTTTPPVAPIGLVATPVSTTRINLSWVDRSNNETAFAIFRKTGAGAYTRIALTAPNVTTFADPSLTPNTTYTYEVRATNNVGASAWTNEASATTASASVAGSSDGKPPAAPTGLVITGVVTARVSLAWKDNSNNETAFAIFRKVGAGAYVRIALTAPNTTSYADTTVAAHTSYTYEVRATNNIGASAWTNQVTATTP